MDFEDILARRQEHKNYYGLYFLKLDIKEHLLQLRVQKEQKKKKHIKKYKFERYTDFLKNRKSKEYYNGDFYFKNEIKNHIAQLKQQKLEKQNTLISQMRQLDWMIYVLSWEYAQSHKIDIDDFLREKYRMSSAKYLARQILKQMIEIEELKELKKGKL